MNYEQYKNKFAMNNVFNYELYNKYGELLTKINTVNEEDLNVTKKGRYLLRIKDALVDKTFLDYIVKTPKFEGYIKANTIFRAVDNWDDKNVKIDMPNVKLINYKFKNVVGEIAQVYFLFELFTDTLKGYAVDFKVEG
jgi:hypothetical protein